MCSYSNKVEDQRIMGWLNDNRVNVIFHFHCIVSLRVTFATLRNASIMS